MTEAKHHPAAFINAIAEEGTKEEAIEWLQKTWNELCEVREALRVQEGVVLVPREPTPAMIAAAESIRSSVAGGPERGIHYPPAVGPEDVYVAMLAAAQSTPVPPAPDTLMEKIDDTLHPMCVDPTRGLLKLARDRIEAQESENARLRRAVQRVIELYLGDSGPGLQLKEALRDTEEK